MSEVGIYAAVIAPLFLALPSRGFEYTSGTCPECWIEQDGVCKPDATKYTLTCNPDGVQARVNKCLFKPGEIYRHLNDRVNCTESSNHVVEDPEDAQNWLFTYGLGECGTTQELVDNHLVFSNTIVAETEPDDESLPISMYTKSELEFRCKYPSLYEISQENGHSLLPHLNGTVDEQEGEFGFNVDMYSDSSFSSLRDLNGFKAGSYLHFRINANQEIPDGIEYAVHSCRVRAPGISYLIYNDGCANAAVKTMRYDYRSFHYRLFTFKHTDETELTLSCKVNVCLSSIAGSTCKRQEDDSCDGSEQWVESNTL